MTPSATVSVLPERELLRGEIDQHPAHLGAGQRSAVLFSIDWLPAVSPRRATARCRPKDPHATREIELLGGDLPERGQNALPSSTLPV
jgi:hypothetical protein